MTIWGGETNAGGVLSSQDTGSRWRAKRARSVGMGECHSALGEAFDIGRLVELGVPKKSGVSPAQVIRKDENDVWLFSSISADRE